MEVLEILEKNSRDLYPEDLDFLETELATGDYTDEYKKLCRDKLSEVRRFLAGDDTEEKKDESKFPNKLVVGIDKIAPKDSGAVTLGMTEEELVLQSIKSIRQKEGYKTAFKNYIKDTEAFNEAFVEKNFTFFTVLELDAIIMTIEFSESFLEKYYGAFGKDKIARYQKFSEGFFMKHFNDLDYNIVLTSGRNDWRKKENRSRQLDVFLRLKGINI